MGNSVPLVGRLELCKGRDIKQKQASKQAREHARISFSLLLIVDVTIYLKSLP